MSQAENLEERAAWCRRFASAANNRAWTLSEQLERTPDEDQEMLHAAHAAAHLWQQIGLPQNNALADMLLGQVHALLGNSAYAMLYATRSHQFFNSRSSEAWELALAHAILANAAFCSADAALHRSSYQTAQEWVAQLNDPQDKEIVLATLRVVPEPSDR